MKKSIILNTDSYKSGMWKMYPPGTTGVYTYTSSRGGPMGPLVFFNLQAYIQKTLMTPVTMEDVDFAERFTRAHGGEFNREAWVRVVQTHGGLLPLEIRAVPEGTLVPSGVPMVTVENTDPLLPQMTTHVETSLLRAVWYGTTVATRSHRIRQLIGQYMRDTGDVAGLDFALHDFGARGASSEETAEIGGAAHLINFNGTDTLGGIIYAMEHYDTDVCGYSIPAGEHSTFTSWGRDNEEDAYQNMLNQFGQPGRIFAAVSDSYDIYNAVENIWGGTLRDQVIASGATVVIRPDSGDPVVVIRRLIEILGQKFGFTVNPQGFRVLNHVRLIQGDGVNESAIQSILGMLKAGGWSANNIAFGMGGELLQNLTRDTAKFATKASSALINGQWVDVYKDPITDPGKTSLRGRVTAYQSGVQLITGLRDIAPREWSDHSQPWTDSMRLVYRNGETFNRQTFDEIRRRART